MRDLVVRAILVAALASLSCSEADSQLMDGGASCAGANCVGGDQMCPEGEVVSGLDPDGTIVCVAQAAIRQQTCSGRLVVGGIRADGSVVCVDPITVGSCDAGEVMTGVAATGELLCESLDVLVRDYVNTRCYVYFGWRDSCDGCVDPPVKSGRVRGDAMDCSVAGGDGNCATFDLFGQSVQMAAVNTDGDVNDDDKFWIGLKCE